MLKKIFLLSLLFIAAVPSYSQFDKLFKKIPGVDDFLNTRAVTTSIKDAYPVAFWLDGIEKQIPLSESDYTPGLLPGYYKFNMKTYCLHAGAYAPTEGSGYLIAPLKGSKAGVIKDILRNSIDHSEIDQHDIQMLIWGIEAGMKFTDFQPDFQLRVAPLLSPEDIAKMEIDINKVANMVLPQEVKDMLQLYSDIRTKIADVNSSFEDVERLAVKVGIPPIGPGSKTVNPGSWSAIGNGYYVRSFPISYPRSVIEVYKPENITVSRDSQGRIISYEDANYKIQITYDDSQGATTLNTGVKKLPLYRFKVVQLTNVNTVTTRTINDAGWSIPAKGIGIESSPYARNSDPDITAYDERKKGINTFVKKLKKYLDNLPKSQELSDKEEVKVRELKSLQLGIKAVLESNGYWGDAENNFLNLTTDALNNYIDEISGNQKGSGGNNNMSGGLDLSGMVAAPGNTAEQRLGTGGPGEGNGNKNPKKKEKECNVSVLIHQVNDFELPQPDWVYHTTVDIDISGGDEECQAEEIQFTLFDVSHERGRCINDNDQYDDMGPDLVINSGYTNPDLNVTSSSTAGKTLSGGSQSVPINITCNDYGAYGKLRASVKVKGQWYDADADGAPDKYITIPVDLNNNKIADAWEKQNNVYGMQADWDEDPQPTGQARNGDGLTNYEEYRGAYVSDGNGGVEHIRLKPKQKEIFVIDEGQIFSPVSWESASGIKAYWLTKNQVFGDRANGDAILSNKVDFCSGFDQAPAGSKFAIRLEKVDIFHDPHGFYPDDSLPLGYTYKGIGPPKNILYSVIFVARIQQWFQDIYVKKLNDLIKKNPNGVTIHGKYFSKATLDYFLNAVTDPSKLQQLVDQEVNTTVIHELGHACGLEHHETGDVKCPMCWGARLDQAIDDRMYNIMTMIDNGEKNIIAIYTYLKFCHSGENCWSKLNVNDR